MATTQSTTPAANTTRTSRSSAPTSAPQQTQSQPQARSNDDTGRTSGETQQARQPSTAFWKPYMKDNKPVGAAVLFNFSPESRSGPRIFMEMRPQISDGSGDQDKFDRESSIRTMLGQADLGEMLLVLRGRKGGVGALDGSNFKGLFHKHENGSTTINFNRNERGGIYIRLGSKRGNDQLYSLSLNLTDGEAEWLHEYLVSMIPRMF